MNCECSAEFVKDLKSLKKRRRSLLDDSEYGPDFFAGKTAATITRSETAKVIKMRLESHHRLSTAM